jgi:predicted DsbA family dithiol-disulfide isomerase
MSVGDFVELCAKASLEGRTVAGPDGTHHLRFGWFHKPPRPVDRQAYLDLGVASGASRGPDNAPVTIVSFLDIANPHGFGGQMIATLSEVLATHADVRVVVKLCPLSPAHEIPAEAVYAAHAQGALWPMLERIAANLERLALHDLVDHAIALGLDAPQFRADLERRAFRDAVELDQDQMAAMEIDALPHALINGRRVFGALPAATYADAVERALRRARLAVR